MATIGFLVNFLYGDFVVELLGYVFAFFFAAAMVGIPFGLSQ
jgi:uncharacterized membrane protein YccF (DUF307 family)